MNWLRKPGMNAVPCLMLAAGCCLFVAGISRMATPVAAATGWNETAAASHMDERQAWWMKWPKARRDHDTACVSCHTALPYALGRANLRGMMGVQEQAAPEIEMLGYVTKRVNGWSEMEPFYGEKSGPRKTFESRNAEAVLNALILARYDSLNGTLSPSTRTAFENMWATQLTTGDDAGGWEWLNFHYAPWEGETSAYYGATLAALAVGYTPASYRTSPAVATNLAALRGYLQRNYDAQPLLNKALLLWACTRLPGVLTKPQRSALIAELERNQGNDGGWSLASMGTWKRKDDTPIDTREDGYATALSLLALKSAGLPNKAAPITEGVAWLVAHQDPTTGMWTASSLNKERPPASDPALFMSDAATGFAVLALDAAR